MNAQAESVATRDIQELGLTPEELNDPDYVPPYTIDDILRIRADVEAGRIKGTPWEEVKAKADALYG
jgi:hypothetical protein